jgi:SAM-dependent methyltransferase
MPSCACGFSNNLILPYYSEGEIDFRLCPQCGLVFRYPLPSDSELVEIYRQAYDVERISSGGTNQESGLYAAVNYSNFIRSLVGNNPARVLDFGAGSGQLVAQLRTNGLQADGLEFSAEARRYCEKVRGFSLLSELSEVKDGQYDFVSMIEVIEHLTELQTTLSELHRVLAPGGSLLITTPNLRGYRARKEKGYWHEACKKFHLFLFTEDSLRIQLDQAGFSSFNRMHFGPLQRPGLKFWLAARLSQMAGLGGTLCVLARRGKN